MKKFICVVAFLFLGTLFIPTTADATGLSSPIELEGFAWSSNIGWVSMSCANNNSCVGDPGSGTKVDYGVTLNTDGTLTGYAWSENIGWVKFGGMSTGDMPVSARVLRDNAEMTGTFPGTLTARGWARACAGAANASSCSGGTNSSSGGWDGWIALGDLMGSYGITADSSGVTSGSYAWGADVVGWVDFSPTVFGTPAVPVPIIDSLSANPTSIALGANSVLTYEVSNADTCTATNNRSQSDWDGSVSNTNDTYTVTPPINTTRYTLTCSSAGGSDTEFIDITAEPDLTITGVSVSPGVVSSAGYYDTVDVQFTIVGIPSGFDNVPYEVIFDGDNQSGSVDGDGTPQVVTVTYTNVPFASNIPYSIEVDDSPNVGVVPEVDDTNRFDGQFTLVQPDPFITITAPDIVRSGDSVELLVELEAPYDVSCDVTGPGITDTVTITGGVIGAPVTATQTVGPSAPLTSTTQFMVDCGALGTSETFTVEVIPTFQEI